MKDLNDVNLYSFDPVDYSIDKRCDTCGCVIDRSGRDGLASRKSGSIFSAIVTTRQHEYPFVSGSYGNNLIITSSQRMFFCSRLCRSVYKARLVTIMRDNKFYQDRNDTKTIEVEDWLRESSALRSIDYPTIAEVIGIE